ncbi:MAG: DUF1702 family protein [Myxococcota bacterium]
MKSLRSWVLGLDPRDVRARVSVEGCDSSRIARFEAVSGQFLAGYEAALEAKDLAVLANRLERMDASLRPFAYQGVGMALAADDTLAPWRRRTQLDRFLAGPGHRYEVPLLFGAGAAWGKAGHLARSNFLPPVSEVSSSAARIQAVLRGLAYDGWGSQEGLFHADRTIDAARRPRGVPAEAAGLFDSGVGRSLWMQRGASSEAIARTIEGFAAERASDLWAGVGYACAMVGGATAAQVDELVARCGVWRPSLAQGVALANRVQLRSGGAGASVAIAVTRVCGLSAAETDRFFEDALLSAVVEPASGLDAWRTRLRLRFDEAFGARRAKRRTRVPSAY